ncbi:MAG: hypothetical protein IJ868_05295 [Prevotella sp.]|nr:hypothetical protein [Prevotella sp.]
MKIKQMKDTDPFYPQTIPQAVVDPETMVPLDVTLEDLQGQVAGVYVAKSRLKDAQDPEFTKTYGTSEALEAILSHFKIGAFRGSELVKECIGGRLTMSVEGQQIALDGTDGDILPYIDHGLSLLRATGAVDGEQRSVIGLGLGQFAVGKHTSKRLKPFAAAMNATVATRLAGDARACQHSIYNPEVAGYYNAAPGWFKQSYRTNGKGYPDTHCNAIGAYTTAQDRNADNTKKGDSKPLHHDYIALWYAAMYMELGTLDFTRADLFGTGCTNTPASATTFADAAVSGVSGMMTVTAGGTKRYFGLCGQNLKLSAEEAFGHNTDGLTGASDRYNFTEMLEMQRFLDHIRKTGNETLSGSDYIYTEGGLDVITDGSVNLATGEGMVPGRKYYQWRDVPGCKGLKDQVMTAVVNVYVRMEASDGLVNSGGDDLTGGYVVFKMSHGVYRGVDLLDGRFIHLAGTHFVFKNIGGGYSLDYYHCDDAESLPVVRNVQDDWYVDADANDIPFLEGYEKGATGIPNTDGWAKECDYSKSLWAYLVVGGSMHYYENGYIWKNSSWGSPAGQYPAEGKKCVNASVAGCSAYVAFAGRTVICFHAVSPGYDSYARGFAQTNLRL